MVFPPIRMKLFATDAIRMQVFIKDDWYNLDDYWNPGYESVGLDTLITRQIKNKKSTKQVGAWVNTIGQDGCLPGYQRKLCKKKDGLYNLF